VRLLNRPDRIGLVIKDGAEVTRRGVWSEARRADAVEASA
jgi:hypothetical protein